MIDKGFVDLHTHFIPGIDDGACDYSEALKLIELDYEQGVRHIFLSSHSRDIIASDKYEYYYKFDDLVSKCKEKFPDLKLYCGSEVYCRSHKMDKILECLENGSLPSMNLTSYVLAEFYNDAEDLDYKEMKYCLQRLIQNDWKPIIAHAERYDKILGDSFVEAVKELKAMGCLIQINSFSVIDDENNKIRHMAQTLLSYKLVDFIGSDAHRTKAINNKKARPSKIKNAVNYMYEHYDKEYVDTILLGTNAGLFGKQRGGKIVRARRKAIFEDTRKQYETNDMLIESIKNTISKQVIIPSGPLLCDGRVGHKYNDKASVIVSTKRTFEAAAAYKDKKVCVLNFANAYIPGGGVLNGAGAQEEGLCRSSTLYACITDYNVLNNFHNKHKYLAEKKHFSNLANSDCVYSPEVTVFKADVGLPEMMKEDEWYNVNVITCVAPDYKMNAGYSLAYLKKKLSEEDLKELHKNRGRRILEIAKRQENEVVILGAFGCGAFGNPPQVVAEAYKEIISEYQYDFETIEFAIYSSSSDSVNYSTFKSVIGE